MAKGQLRSNKEAKKPKKDKVVKPASTSGLNSAAAAPAKKK